MSRVVDNLRSVPYTSPEIQVMTRINPSAVPTDATPRGVTQPFLRVARLAIVALTVLLVIVAIPAYYKRQHIVPLAGVSTEIKSTGEIIFTQVVSGTPSALAGILPGDALVAINGQALENNPSSTQILKQINGWVNTPVTLTVRTGNAVPRTCAVIRSPEPGSVAARLASLNISIDLLVNFMVFMDIVVLLVYLAVSVILISRGRGTSLTYFASIALVTFGAAATSSMQFLALEPSPWGWLAGALVPAGFAAAFTFLGFLYPSGQWVPRCSRILVGIVWIWTIVQWFWPAARPVNWDPVIGVLVYLVMIIAMFISQVYRYRRVATPTERQQIKWFVLALASVVVGYAISQVAAIFINQLGQVPTRASAVVVFILWQISVLGYLVPYALLAVAIGLALLKHRLWDIDIVINQSLVYSTLTAMLAIMSTVILAVLNILIGRLFGKVPSLLAVAITAAFPVAAFNPLRARIQRLVDRRVKPEEVNFSETSALLALEVQALLAPGELLATLVRAVAGQLDLVSAAAYTPATGERLVLAHETPSSPGPTSELHIDDAIRDKLLHGKVVMPPEDSGFSFFVPLTTAKTHTHGLRGVLALGPRRSGKGFTTPLERGLQELGVEAGKALYVAQLREASLLGIEGRLEMLERRITSLKQAG